MCLGESASGREMMGPGQTEIGSRLDREIVNQREFKDMWRQGQSKVK